MVFIPPVPATNKSPAEVIRSLSVGVDDPSAVVLNVNLPGISLEPGVPSTNAAMRAARLKFPPSYP